MEIIVQCCVCGLVRQPDGSWQAKYPTGLTVSHTYCPPCREKAIQELNGKPREG